MLQVKKEEARVMSITITLSAHKSSCHFTSSFELTLTLKFYQFGNRLHAMMKLVYLHATSNVIFFLSPPASFSAMHVYSEESCFPGLIVISALPVPVPFAFFVSIEP